MSALAYAFTSGCALAWRVRSHLGFLSEGKAIASCLKTLSLEVLDSKVNTILLLNLAFSLFSVAALWTKHLFFGRLTDSEKSKLTERLINYVLFKGVLVGSVVSQEVVELAMWIVWFALLGFLKMFAVLARDRSEQLSSSPSATRRAHAKTVVFLLLLLSLDCYWAEACVRIFHHVTMSDLMLLLFETVVIAIHTTQTLVRYSFQLIDSYRLNMSERDASSKGGCGDSAVVWEWKSTFLYHSDLVGDVLTLALSLCHYCHVWLRHGVSIQIVDAILFLNIRSISKTLKQRIDGYRRYKQATHNLQALFVDASVSDLDQYGDDCAVCREKITVGKKLPCGHIFHLGCLRSWLDIATSENYSCPTCRRSLLQKQSGSFEACTTFGLR